MNQLELKINVENKNKERNTNYATDRLQALKNQCSEVENRILNIVSAETFGNWVLVQCGRYLKYTQIIKTKDFIGCNHIKTKQNQADYLLCDFQNAKYNFSTDIEIYKLRSTALKDVFQIIAKDELENILIVLTWDFKNNYEVSML